MKKRKQILITALIVVFALLIFLPSCQKAEKRAIIILPGIMGSGLYDGESEDSVPLWDPFYCNVEWAYYLNHKGGFNVSAEDLGDLVEELLPLIDKIMAQSDDSVFKIMAVDEDGEPVHPDRVKPATMDYQNPERLRYGVFKNALSAYQSLNERYGDRAEVSVFNYDWRIDVTVCAELLEKYINDKGYDDVVIVAHSMGGVVTSQYLARSQKNRDKVSCFLSLNSPLLGGVSALQMLENTGIIINNVVNDLSKIDVVAGYLDSLFPGSQQGFGVEMLRDVVQEDFLTLMNIKPIFQLLPRPELLDSKHFYNIWEFENYEKRTGFVKVNGEDLTTKEELLDFYKSRPFSKKTDGELKAQLNGLEDFWDSVFFEKNGERVHVTSLVNTHYFTGLNVSTPLYVDYDAPMVNNKPSYSDALFNEALGMSRMGDSTVLTYSATANNSIHSPNVHLVENADHLDLIVNFDYYVAKEAYKILDKIFG